MGVNSLPKTVTRQRRDCDLNPGPSAPESRTLTTRLPSHLANKVKNIDCSQVWAYTSITPPAKVPIPGGDPDLIHTSPEPNDISIGSSVSA